MFQNESFSRYTDIRAIHMEREREHSGRPEEAEWLTLGHFNWTHIENLSDKLSNITEVDLDGIRKENLAMIRRKTNHKSYCHPIYILREFDYNQRNVVTSFWDKQSAFMAITRINSTILNQLDFEKSIDNHLDFSNHIESDKALSSDVIYIRYRTLDLSDVVLIMKSDSVYALMRALGKLYSTYTVGDIYSYYCIKQSELFENCSPQLAVATDSRILASIRFAVRDAMAMDSFLKELKKLPHFEENKDTKRIYFVTGTEDINAITPNISSAELCKILKFIHEALSNSQEFCIAADDITTRIGIPEADLVIDCNGRSGKNHDNKLTSIFTELRAKLIATLANESPRDWHRTIIETLDSLIEMSSDAILRPVCFVLLGSMNGIIDKVSKKLIDCSEMEQELNEFLIGTTYVMEHILRMEGELVHHPETRPLLFDIPESILEFDLALVDRCARYFKTREYACQDFELLKDADNREYAFLLVPRLYTNITIHDFFNKRDDNLRLLYVEIPLSLMYNPFEVACSLVHEVAHHSGEITRHRHIRHSRLCYCCAVIIAEALGIDTSSKTIDVIYRRLSILLKGELQKNGWTNRAYLRELLSLLFDLSQKIFCNKEICLDFIKLYIEEAHSHEEPHSREEIHSHAIPSSQLFDDVYTNYMESRRDVTSIVDIQKRINEVASLFSECYADLAMKTLLSLSDDEYLRLLLNDYLLYSPKHINSNYEKKTNMTYVFLIERVAMVLCATNPNVLLSLQQISQNYKDLKDFAYDLELFSSEYLKSGSRTTKNLPHNSGNEHPCLSYHAFSILDAIRGYLEQCLDTMTKLDNMSGNSEEKRQIVKCFETFAKEKRLASNEFLDEINQYRTRITTTISSG